MSVYTTISDNEFSEILKNYSLGSFICSQGINAGIENTNYFITTTKGEYVFTLFENINPQELNVYISLLQDLSGAGIACPQPQINIHKQFMKDIKSKPYTLVTRLKGKSVTSVNLTQCKAIAFELAKLHTTSLPTSILSSKLLKNKRGKIWRETTAFNLINTLSRSDAKLLKSELEVYQSFDDTRLPKGIIHADLFKDNALFANNELCGIIDFYDACYDNYLYDVAITVNAWCTDEDGRLNTALADAFLQSYQTKRELSEEEKQAWPIMLRIAAMRFWLSRLQDALSQRQGDLTHCKNPEAYRRILQNHINPIFTASISH